MSRVAGFSIHTMSQVDFLSIKYEDHAPNVKEFAGPLMEEKVCALVDCGVSYGGSL